MKKHHKHTHTTQHRNQILKIKLGTEKLSRTKAEKLIYLQEEKEGIRSRISSCSCCWLVVVVESYGRIDAK